MLREKTKSSHYCQPKDLLFRAAIWSVGHLSGRIRFGTLRKQRKQSKYNSSTLARDYDISTRAGDGSIECWKEHGDPGTDLFLWFFDFFICVHHKFYKRRQMLCHVAKHAYHKLWLTTALGFFFVQCQFFRLIKYSLTLCTAGVSLSVAHWFASTNLPHYVD